MDTHNFGINITQKRTRGRIGNALGFVRSQRYTSRDWS